MKKLLTYSPALALLSLSLAACSDAPIQQEKPLVQAMSKYQSGDTNYQLKETSRVLVTNESGDKVADKQNISFVDGKPSGTVIVIRPDIVKQTMYGVGTSFTESSAFVLAHLTKEKRGEVMRNAYSDKGANFSLARTHIGATDFAVEGKYSYVDVPGDADLESFTLAEDTKGFDVNKYPGVVDPSYDLLPMIQEAIAIKDAQDDKELQIIASAWTAPSWMKDINEWYIPGTAENGHAGTGGSLLPEYVPAYADYLVKYLQAYQEEGVDIWGLTPVNEPHGNNGQWESMHFTAESQRDFITEQLGPKLHANNFEDLELLMLDHNRDGLAEWADIILADEEATKYVKGTAVHWYESTNLVYEDILEETHNKYPNFSIINTEATIDDLGKPAPVGIADTEKFTESNWFNNDSFWWNENATDWAYTAEWAPNAEAHPIYTPVHRYARNIIVSFNHWMNGWMDWNVVLDQNGGPNHVGNFCGAPIMIDTINGDVYYTPIFHVLSQFSQTIRPGDRAVQASKFLDGLDNDDLHASATINDTNLLTVQLLNTTKQPIEFLLQVGTQHAEVKMTANAVQTIQVQL